MSKTYLVLAGLVLLMVGGFCFYLFFPGIKFSDGRRSGVVFKISTHQLPVRTHEGELSLGLNEVGGDGTVVPKIFHFSVSSNDILSQLQEADRKGKRITLHYAEYMFRGRYWGETNIDVLGIE